MSYFKFLTFTTILLIFGCSSTPSVKSSINKTSNLVLGIKAYEANDVAEAKTLLQEACDQHFEAACLKISNIFIGEDNFKEAQNYLKRACDYGSLRACARLGAKYIQLNQLKEARAVLEKSNHVNSTSEIFMVHLYMAEKRVAEAKKLASTLCSNQFPMGCTLRADIAYSENDLLTAKKFFPLDIENKDSNSMFLGIVELQLGNIKAGTKLISDSCSGYEPLGCRIKKLLDLQKVNPSFEKDYTLKCAQSDKEACYNLGLHYFLKRKKDLSSNYFKKSCKLGHGNGCLEKYNENAFAMQPPLPVNVLIEACEKDSASACYVVYEYYRENEASVTIAFLEKACTLGNSLACYKLGFIEWKNKNIDKSIKKYDESCKLDLQDGCFYSQFLDKNEETQEAVAQKFCSEKNEMACKEIADIYNKKEKKILAQIFYEKSCSLNNLRSCSMAIELKGQIDPTFKTTMPHYDLCKKGYAYSCSVAGEFLDAGKQKKDAINMLERGCFLNDSKGCDFLGWIYKEEKNETKSKHFFKQGCDLGSVYSCERI